jgi:uncharacterized membrane protein
MKFKKYVAGLIPLLVIVVSLFLPGIAFAQDEGESVPPTVSMSTEFPKIEAQATDTFSFAITLKYSSNNTIQFDLTTTAPTGWTSYVTPQYDSTRISSISGDASLFGTTKNIKLVAVPPSFPYEKPGDYTISLKAESGDTVGTIDVTAKILPKAVLTAVPASDSGLYNTRAKAGKDNIYSIKVTDTGTSDVQNVTFTASSKPDGWDVTFSPDKLDSLGVLTSQTVDVKIKPPSNTTSGDYMLTLQVSGKDVSNTISMDIRVTVESSTIWGWVGVIIIVIVIAGLFVIFMRFGRR